MKTIEVVQGYKLCCTSDEGGVVHFIGTDLGDLSGRFWKYYEKDTDFTPSDVRVTVVDFVVWKNGKTVIWEGEEIPSPLPIILKYEDGQIVARHYAKAKEASRKREAQR
jgi:hypothetical protein